MQAGQCKQVLPTKSAIGPRLDRDCTTIGADPYLTPSLAHSEPCLCRTLSKIGWCRSCLSLALSFFSRSLPLSCPSVAGGDMRKVSTSRHRAILILFQLQDMKHKEIKRIELVPRLALMWPRLHRSWPAIGPGSGEAILDTTHMYKYLYCISICM